MPPAIALFGGSFDPPHLGHLRLARAALDSAGIGAVWLLPITAHPAGKKLAPFPHRLAMCRLMARDLGPAASVLEADREAGARGRSLPLVDYLAARHPGWQFRLLLGGDAAALAPRWPGWARIAALAPPLVFARFDADMPLSSTESRRRVAAGESTESLLQADVRAHLDLHALYRRKA